MQLKCNLPNNQTWLTTTIYEVSTFNCDQKGGDRTGNLFVVSEM